MKVEADWLVGVVVVVIVVGGDWTGGWQGSTQPQREWLFGPEVVCPTSTYSDSAGAT